MQAKPTPNPKNPHSRRKPAAHSPIKPTPKAAAKPQADPAKSSSVRRGSGRGSALRWLGSSWLWTGIGLLVFILLACHQLAGINSEYLYAVQEHNLWLSTGAYWADKAVTIAGPAQWLGCYFTQYFFHPWLGTCLLIGCWIVVYFLSILAFRLRGAQRLIALIPLFALLLSEVAIGYWLFYVKSPGYWFTPTLSYIVFLLAVLIGRTLRGWWRAAAVIVLAAVLYPLIGWWALLVPLWGTGYVQQVLGRWLNKLSAGEADPSDSSPTLLQMALCLLAIVVIPLIYYQLNTRLRLGAAWIAGLPVFETERALNVWLSVPFIVCAVVPLCYVRWRAKVSPWLYGLLAAVFICVLTLVVDRYTYRDANFNCELRTLRALREMRYTDVLSEPILKKGPCTRQLVLAKNIALMHHGGIGDQLFVYDNSGQAPQVFDSLRVHLAQTCGMEVYYQYGKTNFAYRWAIENGVEYGFNVEQLQTLVRCSMMNGERRAARKYIDLLLCTTFHREWAQQWLDYLNHPQHYYQSADYRLINPLRVFENTIDGDEGLIEMYIINYFSHMQKREPKFQEQTLVYALIQKDIQLFWPRFFQYASHPVHVQEPMPIHYQEAAYLYGQLEDGVDISSMPFDKQRIVQRYANFTQATQNMLRAGMSTDQIGTALKPAYGDTFWWFYYFCRNIHSY